MGAWAVLLAAGVCWAGELVTVAGQPGYNSWPMIGHVGDRVVCAYSKGVRHSIGEGVRGTYAKWSDDGGRTWSREILIDNAPESGEVPIGKGRLADGSMLLWNRAANYDKTHHDLFRTADGEKWERLAVLRPDPMPMQITDIMNVDNRLVSFWFACSYGREGTNAWGLLSSEDGGKSWRQTVVERLERTEDLPTEQCGVYLGNGRFFAVARSEGTKGQYQLTSADGGKAWKKERTNIRDVSSSTPSLLYDAKTDTVWNYYYNRADGTLRRRIAKVADVFAHPDAWPEPEILFAGGGRGADAGNVNVHDGGDGHLAAFYDGQASNTVVRVLSLRKVSEQCVISSDQKNEIRVCSPDGRNQIALKTDALAYEVRRDCVEVVSSTPIALMVNGNRLAGGRKPSGEPLVLAMSEGGGFVARLTRPATESIAIPNHTMPVSHDHRPCPPSRAVERRRTRL